MSKVIIGVHGLNNKPPRPTLAEWWKKSLIEGLEHVGVKNPDFKYRMVYWADLLYSQPQHTKQHWAFDDLYNKEPYIAAKKGELKAHKDGWRDSLRAKARGAIGDTVDWLKGDFGVDEIADWALGRLLKDLAFYYSNKNIENRAKPPALEPARKLLRSEVARAVKEEHAAGNEILLIGHSMGSITSYDALRGIGRERNNKVEVANFVTIGSPLGLPHVKHKIIDEWTKRRGFEGGDPQLRTPTVVTGGWTNFADRKDPVAVDIHLGDDFEANAKGVGVKDDLILNDYHTFQKRKRKNNHHKSYGYLRTPEMAEYVKGFLGL
jgi:hypothetical protein